MSYVLRRLISWALALPIAGLLSAAGAPARAQDDFPNHPVRLIVGFAAGGGNDIFARLVGGKLSEILKQPVVIENRPGAGGRLSAEYVSNQPADGYTLLVGATGAMSMAPAIYPDLKYHPIETLTPLALMGGYPLILVVGANNPSRDVRELVEWAKQHPDKANYPSTSPAFVIAMEQLKLKTGMPCVMIPYKSSSEMVFSLIDGQTMASIVDPPPAVPQVQAGKLKALAVTGNERLAELPDVPSMAQIGYPGVDVRLWSGVFAPAATPAPVVAKLEKALDDSIRDPDVAAKFKNLGVTPGGGPAADFKRMIDTEIAKYQDLVKAANLHFEE
ncbi:MAG TPA: tripartite tricarboxylate transporter substrate binding protein [Xanthobacteraceae bacterium]|nr:tripartite tricarboxylate transporter substrate binding protein [Xanthobacteraceae bacterium]